jgi:hypothetical protein
MCGLDSQKAANLARDDRVSLTIDHDTPDLMAITGLSMAGHARAVVDRAEASKVCSRIKTEACSDPERYSGQSSGMRASLCETKRRSGARASICALSVLGLARRVRVASPGRALRLLAKRGRAFPRSAHRH